MLKAVLFGVWSIAATAGSLIVGTDMLADPQAGEHEGGKKMLPPVFSEEIQVIAPVVQKSKPSGYLFTRLTLRMDAEHRSALQVPLQYILQDSYNAFVVGNVKGAFPQEERFDVGRFRSGIAATINASVGAELVIDLYVSQINFVSKDSARQKQNRTIAYKQNAPDPEDKPKEDSKSKGKKSDN